MNPRCPTVTLTAVESERLRCLVRDHGERAAMRMVGLSRETFFKAAGQFPVARLTANAIRFSLDRI